MRSRGRHAVRRRLPVDSDNSFHPGSISDEESAWDDSPCTTLVNDGVSCCDSDDSSPQDEELFDIERADEDPGYESDLTDDFNDDGNIADPDDFDGDVDVADLDLLLDGNENSPEYYLKGLAEFIEADFDGQDYSDGSKALLDRIEELWRE